MFVLKTLIYWFIVLKVRCIMGWSVSSYIKIYTLKSGYVDTGSPSVGSSRSWKSMEMEIQSLLEKLLDINDAMSRCAASAAPATSVTQKLARHRDILHEFGQVYFLLYTFFYALAHLSQFKRFSSTAFLGKKNFYSQ